MLWLQITHFECWGFTKGPAWAGVVSANRVEEEFIFFPVYSVLPITVWLQSVSAINVGWYLPARHSGRNLGCWGWSKIISQGDWKSQQKRAHSWGAQKSPIQFAASRKWLTVECTADDIIISYYIFYFYSLLFERQFKSDLTRHLGDHE